MFDELLFSPEPPAGDAAYTGGGACLPQALAWPRDAEGVPLTHLLAIPGSWFCPALKGSGYWVSLFIPYQPGEVAHYRRLRAREGACEAVVMGYLRAAAERHEAPAPLLERGSIRLLANADPDDDENLASKLDGVDAWLQSALSFPAGRRRLSIYGGDLDQALPAHKGILSDGMGYLFLDEDFAARTGAQLGGFFLQLG